MIKIEYDDFKNVLECLVEQKKTFTIINIKNGISKVVKEVEKSIEERKMQCRVYTSSRSALVGGIFIPTGITQVTGIASAGGIAAHNIVTWEADYRIVKCLIDKEVEVINKTYNPSKKMKINMTYMKATIMILNLMVNNVQNIEEWDTSVILEILL